MIAAALSPEMHRAFEAFFAADLSGVRFVIDPTLGTRGVYAEAQGAVVHLSSEVLAAPAVARIALIGHELAHVLQQRAGRVRRLSNQGPGSIVADPLLEAEAETAGASAAHRFAGLVPCFRPLSVGADAPMGSDPIQCALTARESYERFRDLAWDYLEANAINIEPSCCFFTNRTLVGDPTAMLNDLYGVYSAFNPNHVPAKQALAGQALYTAMAGFLTNTQALQILLQDGNWPDITADKGNLIDQYQQDKLGNLATVATDSYIHVYPPYQHPIGKGQQPVEPVANWRLGVNVEPNQIADAMTAFRPILTDDAYDQNNQQNVNNIMMGHAKFAMPALAAKPDSAIFYIRRRTNGNAFTDQQAYDAFQGRVWTAVQQANIALQPKMGPMWEEVHDGFAEASEPPNNGGSFGMYRVILTYLAYAALINAGARWFRRRQFNNVMAAAFDHYGVPHDHPQLQRSVAGLGQPARLAFLRLYAYMNDQDGDQVVQNVNALNYQQQAAFMQRHGLQDA